MKSLLIIALSLVSIVYSQENELSEQYKIISNELFNFHYNGSEKDFHMLRAKLERFNEDNSKDWYLLYYQAYIFNQLGTFNLKTDEDKADEFFDKGLEYIEKAIKIKDSAELHAMKADIYGKKISISSFRGMSLGPKSQSEIETAKKINDKIPYVRLVEAINLMMTPGFFGGDKEESRKILLSTLKSLEEFKYEDEKMINIGKADIYAWLSQLDILEDDMKSAKENAKKALELQSDYAFVKYGLMPKLKED